MKGQENNPNFHIKSTGSPEPIAWANKIEKKKKRNCFVAVKSLMSLNLISYLFIWKRLIAKPKASIFTVKYRHWSFPAYL